MDTCIDKDLIIQLHNDDVKSFDKLYLKYHKALYFNILKLIKDPEAAQDLLQDVFVTLWEKRLTIDENKSVENWLFRVSYNKSITHLKKTLQHFARIRNYGTECSYTDEEQVELSELKMLIVEGAVKQLSPQKSKVFVLCKMQGKTYDETAKELKISKHTVKEYLSEAVSNIKDYIKQHPESSTVLSLLSFFL